MSSLDARARAPLLLLREGHADRRVEERARADAPLRDLGEVPVRRREAAGIGPFASSASTAVH